VHIYGALQTARCIRNILQMQRTIFRAVTQT